MPGYGYIEVEVRDMRTATASADNTEVRPSGISRTFRIEDGQTADVPHVYQEFLNAVDDVREVVRRIELEERWRVATEKMTAAQMEAALAVLERDDPPAAAVLVAPRQLADRALVVSATSAPAESQLQDAPPPAAAAAGDAARMTGRPAEPPFFFVREGDPPVYGYRITADRPADAALFRGMEERGLIVAESFSGPSAEGKRGTHPISECRAIAREEFEAAKAVGWR